MFCKDRALADLICLLTESSLAYVMIADQPSVSVCYGQIQPLSTTSPFGRVARRSFTTALSQIRT